MYNLNNSNNKSTRQGFSEALVELGSNKNIVVLSAGVGDSTLVFAFKKKYPDRYVEAGIAEQSMIGLACGMALGNKIPVATSFATFLPGRCYDHIRQSVCYSNLNVKLAATHAGLTVGPDGATHQMMEDIAMMRALPNLKIIVPCDALEAQKATKAMISEPGPIYLRLGREKLPVFTQPNSPFKIGKSVTLKEGKNLTIIATGVMVHHALKAADELKDVRVINMHTIKPIDSDAIIKAAKETGKILTVEEHQIYGGLGSAVAEVVAQHCPVPMKIIGMADTFGESGNPDDLLKKYGLTSADIIKAAKDLISK